MRKEELLKILGNHKQELSKKYRVNKVGIFGSVARDSNEPESDIDIVVDMEPDLLLQAQLQTALEALLNSKVDLVRYWSRMNKYLKAHIDKEAIYV